MNNNQIVTRIAPSPTGKFHIGTARTALFSYLYAKKNNGKFLLRIEDTDQARSSDEHTKDIKDSLSWLGLHWDNKDTEHYQSCRIEEYKKIANKLVSEGYAEERGGAVYFNVKGKMSNDKSNPNDNTEIASPARRDLAMSGRQARSDTPPHPDLPLIRGGAEGSQIIEFTDSVHGKVSTDIENIEDFVILKSDGWPTFHLAVVVDDHDMGVTHVIRGDDHLSNTPKHILLYKALGWELPQWGHLPLILNRDKSKMSKRKDPVSVTDDFMKKGYLPEAIINFLALLGWSPKNDEEFFTLDELVKVFDASNIQKSNAVFDIEKLNHFNNHYLRKMDEPDLLEKVKPLWANAGYDFEALSSTSQQKIINIVKDRANTISDMAVDIDYFFAAPMPDAQKIVFKKSDKEHTKLGLERAINALSALPEDSWDTDDLYNALSDVVEKNNLSNGDVFWPIRYSLTAREASPSPQEVLSVLGKDEALKRLENALNILK